MDRGDFVEAERLFVLADQSAPGFPEGHAPISAAAESRPNNSRTESV